MSSLFQEALRSLGEAPAAPLSAQPGPARTVPQGTPEPSPSKIEEENDGLSLMEGLQFCLTDQAPGDQMPCVATMVAMPDDERCPDHLVMLTQQDCPYCTEAKARNAGLLEEGRLEEVDIFSERGKKLAQVAGIGFTPGLLVVSCEDRLRAVLDNPLHPRLVWREDGGQIQERSEDDGEDEPAVSGEARALTDAASVALGTSAEGEDSEAKEK